MTLYHCVAARIAEPEQAACRTDLKETMAFRIVATAIIVMTGTLRKFINMYFFLSEICVGATVCQAQSFKNFVFW